eukprot:m.174117 g.174117  ORF g.174117 m.174117 type:complete len:1815 (+) comp13791_c0_seq1:54-5498(+)
MNLNLAVEEEEEGARLLAGDEDHTTATVPTVRTRAAAPRTPWQLFRLHLILLIWKNGVLQKRRPISTCCEIFLPIIFILSLVGIRLATLEMNSNELCVRPRPNDIDNKISYYYDCEWPAFSPQFSENATLSMFESGAEMQCRSSGSGWRIGYTPRTAQSDAVMARMRELFMNDDIDSNVTLVPYASEGDMVADLVPESYNPPQNYSCVFGVVFHELDLPTATATYALRFDTTPGYWYGSPQTPYQTSHNDGSWLTDRSFPSVILSVGPRIGVSSVPEPPTRNDNPSWQMLYNALGGSPGYPQNAFIPAQAAMNQALLEKFQLPTAGANETLQNMKLNRFPFPAYKDNTFAIVIQGVLPLFLVLALLFTAISIAKSVVDEKESRLTETFKMMGITATTQWAAWFLQYTFFLCISMSIAVFLLKIGEVLQYSDWTLIWMFLMLFATSSIMLIFIVSVFFTKASTAAAVAGLVWFASYLPYRALTPRWALLSTSDKGAACLLSTTCMSIGANVIGALEGAGTGVTWANMYDPVSADDPFTFATVLSMLFVDTLLYGLIVLYLDAVIPSELGVPKPWYFVLLPSFWRSVMGWDEPTDLNLSIASDTPPSSPQQQGGFFQPLPDDTACGLELRGLRKVFGSGKNEKVAVVGTTLSMTEGEITALLGHNGAGKTTTMSIVCGLMPPSAGTAVVNGFDIRKHLRVAQSQLGLCPQRNTLLPSLTVAEHLWLFAKLKGVSDKYVYREIDQMIADIELLEKRHYTAGTLSGGMKRKLSCALALVGGSPVVILDEPTSGCDPSARRAIWDLLLRNRTGRTMLLSTHHMDEADILGQRVAIMVDGRVECAGTPLSLKAHYGIGYKLSVVTKTEGCSVDQVTHTIQSVVPGALLASAVFADLSYALPRQHTALFPKLFATLENQAAELGVESFGISGASIEDVFLKVGEGSDDDDGVGVLVDGDDDGLIQMDGSDNDRTSPLLTSPPGEFQPETGFAALMLHVRAMFMKRYLHLKRNTLAIIPQLLVPSAFVLFALIIATTFPGNQPLPARDLNAMSSHYGDNTIVLSNVSMASALDLDSGQSVVGLGSHATNLSWALLQYACASTSASVISGCSAPDIAHFNRRTLVALDTPATGSWTAWFNGQAYHTPAEAYALATNAVLNAYGGAPGGGKGKITTINYPLPRTAAEQLEQQTNNGLGFSVALMVIFGMSFLVAYFIIFPVTERASKVKRMQLLSGVNLGVFWSTSFFFDFVNYLIPVIINVVLFAAFAVPSFSGPRLAYVIIIFLVFGLAIVPIMYTFSFLFDDAPTAYSRAVLFNVVTGLVALLTIYILQTTSPDLVTQLKNGFLIFPNFCFGQAFVDMYSNYNVHKYKDEFAHGIGHSVSISCDQLRQLANGSPQAAQYSCQDNYLALEYPGIGKYLLSLFLQAAGYMVLLVLIELNIVTRIVKLVEETLDFEALFAPPKRVTSADENEGRGEDSDVVAERQRVAMADGHRRDGDIVIVKDLTKVYKMPWCSGEVEAVQGLSMGVGRGECFGLLGVNGAGKTSTFKMLTGDESISGGMALINGFDLAVNMNTARKFIGYAPQFDALIDLMTGRELITMFAYLRGIPPTRVADDVNRLIYGLGLQKHADRVCKNYSGGNKRKLSTAMALVGRPPLVLLDEPTTGLDPLARRALWRALTDAMKRGQSIILTSHSMDEVDALATKMAIMVNGSFKCFGTPQHLKSKFGKGGSITVAASDKAAALKFLRSKFPNGESSDDHSQTFTYSIDDNVPLTELFTTMESAKESGLVEDYSISQTTLEQVFIQFARDQTDTEAREHAYRSR